MTNNFALSTSMPLGEMTCPSTIYFPGKLKTRWSGPFKKIEIAPHGAIKISNLSNDTTFTVNGHRFKLFIDTIPTAEEPVLLVAPVYVD